MSKVFSCVAYFRLTPFSGRAPRGAADKFFAGLLSDVGPRGGVARRGAQVAAAASAARCAAKSFWTPTAARASNASISSREKGCPSAVPCNSMKRPSPVETTFMSVSARESSSYLRSRSGTPATIPTLTAATSPVMGRAPSFFSLTRRQHRVACREPALARVPFEGRHAFVERGRADDARAAHLDERGAFGVGHEAGRDANLAHLVCATPVRARVGSASGCEAHRAPRLQRLRVGAARSPKTSRRRARIAQPRPSRKSDPDHRTKTARAHPPP